MRNYNNPNNKYAYHDLDRKKKRAKNLLWLLILLLFLSAAIGTVIVLGVLNSWFAITKQEGETESGAITRVATEFLNKTPYKLLIENGIITKLTKVEMTEAQLKAAVDTAIETVLKTSFVPTVTFNADGTIKACGLKLDLGSTISFNLQIAINQQIEMIDIRNVVAAA